MFTAQKIKFSIKHFFSNCDQIRSCLRIWSHLLKKSLIENFNFSPSGYFKKCGHLGTIFLSVLQIFDSCVPKYIAYGYVKVFQNNTSSERQIIFTFSKKQHRKSKRGELWMLLTWKSRRWIRRCSYGGELARLGGLAGLGEMIFIPRSYMESSISIK